MTGHFLQGRFPLWSGSTQKFWVPSRNFQITHADTTNKQNYSGKSHSSGHPFVCGVVHRWTRWWNNNNASLVYQYVLKTKMKWNHRLYAEKQEKLFVLLAATLFSAFYYHLCCFDVAARRQTFDEYPLFWYEKIDSHERDMRTREHRAVCVNKRRRDAHTVVLLPSAVSMDTHRCKSRETTKRENTSAVCFMRWFCLQKKCSSRHIVFDSDLWQLKTAESREIREPKGIVHLRWKLCYHLLWLTLFQTCMVFFQVKHERRIFKEWL